MSWLEQLHKLYYNLKFGIFVITSQIRENIF